MKFVEVDLNIEPFYKKQRNECPHCYRWLPIEEVMECECGAVFELKIEQIHGPTIPPE
jgi:hypothetical protein